MTDMRYLLDLIESTETDLTEAPIDNYELLGDWSKSSSFRHEQDRKIIANPKGIEKIKQKWARVPQPFNMYFINSPEAGKHTEVGMVDQAWLQQNMPKTYPALDIRSDAINVLFTNNKGDERVPMTAWIISHRFGHSLARYAQGGNGRMRRQMDDFTEARDAIFRAMSNIMADYGREIPDSEGGHNKVNYGWQDGSAEKKQERDKMLKSFYQHIGTMRSARQNEIRNEFEFTLELLSQYMLTGSIKFNPVPKVFKYGRSNYVYFRGTPHDAEYCSSLLADLAEELGHIFENLLNSCIGRTFVM